MNITRSTPWVLLRSRSRSVIHAVGPLCLPPSTCHLIFPNPTPDLNFMFLTAGVPFTLDGFLAAAIVRHSSYTLALLTIRSAMSLVGRFDISRTRRNHIIFSSARRASRTSGSQRIRTGLHRSAHPLLSALGTSNLACCPCSNSV